MSIAFIYLYIVHIIIHSFFYKVHIILAVFHHLYILLFYSLICLFFCSYFTSQYHIHLHVHCFISFFVRSCWQITVGRLCIHMWICICVLVCEFVFVYLYLWHEMGVLLGDKTFSVQRPTSLKCWLSSSTFFVQNLLSFSLYLWFFFCWRRNVIQYMFLLNTICREWLLSIQMLASGVGSHWILPRVKRQKHHPAIHPSSPMALYPPGWQGGGWRVAPERSLESLVERAV